VNRVAVFGITGFSGRHFENFVAAARLDRNFTFYGFGRDLARAPQLGVFSYVQGDATNEREVCEFIASVQPTYVLNLAGRFRAPTFADLLAANVGISRNILEALLRADTAVEKVVLVGSAAEYGSPPINPVDEEAAPRPVNLYGLSKLFQTELAQYFHRNSGLPVVVARTFNILGEGLSHQLSIGSFTHQIQSLPQGGAIRVGDISTSRDFLDIAEVSRRYWNLLVNGVPGQVYNVCSGKPATIRSVLEELIERSGKKITIETDPALYKDRDVAVIYGNSNKYDNLPQCEFL
jgi:GDP-4-dehydro-6-deoxy-D-mannose reductase